MIEPANALDILLVEDEPLIGLMATDMLDAIGHRVVAVIPSVAAALARIETETFNVAILDLNLNDESALPVADRLRALEKRYFFTTGYGSGSVAPPHDDIVVLTKPYTLAGLEAALDHLRRDAG
ncbi:MAG: response regulator [Sphingomonadaceae bacterium]